MSRPRPIRVAFALVAAANSIALAVLPVLQEFEIVAWSGQQMSLVQFLVGTVTTAIGGILAAFHGESQVTPVSDPQNDEGVELVPLVEITEQ